MPVTARLSRRFYDAFGDDIVGLDSLRSELLRWMFIFWVGSVATILVSRLIP